MSYFPFFIDIEGERALVVGGGKVAQRKVLALLEFGAQVKVVADTLCEPLRMLAGQRPQQVELCERRFADDDIEGVLFVVAATDDTCVNHHISVLCRERGILVNVVDQKKDCSFFFPAYVKRGEVVAGVSSGGNSPLLAATIRDHLEEQIPEYYGKLGSQLGGIRQRARVEIALTSDRRRCMEEALSMAQERERLLEDWEIEGLLKKYQKEIL